MQVQQIEKRAGVRPGVQDFQGGNAPISTCKTYAIAKWSRPPRKPKRKTQKIEYSGFVTFRFETPIRRLVRVNRTSSAGPVQATEEVKKIESQTEVTEAKLKQRTESVIRTSSLGTEQSTVEAEILVKEAQSGEQKEEKKREKIKLKVQQRKTIRAVFKTVAIDDGSAERRVRERLAARDQKLQTLEAQSDTCDEDPRPRHDDGVCFDGHWHYVEMFGFRRRILDHPLIEMTIAEIRAKYMRTSLADGSLYHYLELPAGTPREIVENVLDGPTALNMTRRGLSQYSKRYWIEMEHQHWTDWEPVSEFVEIQIERLRSKMKRLPSSGEAQLFDFKLLPRDTVKDLLTGMQPMLAKVSDSLEGIRSTGFWLKVVTQAVFALLHMYQADWTLASVLTSVAQFIITLPLEEILRAKLSEAVAAFLLETIAGPRGHDMAVGYVASDKQVLLPTGGLKQSETGDDEQSADWSKIALAVAAGISTCVATVGLGVLPGGSATNNLFMRLSRLGACGSSLESMYVWFTGVIEKMLDYVRVTWFGYDSQLIDDWKEFDSFCTRVQKMRTPTFEADARVNPNTRVVVERLLEEQLVWQKKLERLKLPHEQMIRFTGVSMALEMMRKAVALSGAGEHRARLAPTFVHVVGGTGVGKSESTNMLNAYLLARFGYTDPVDLHRRIYFRDATQQRWDGYTNGVQGVVWDDFGTVRDTTSNPSNEPVEVIRAENCVPWQLEMANLNEKAQTYFQAKWVILTSNVSTFKWESLTNSEAVARRITRKFVQTVNPAYGKTISIAGKPTVVVDAAKVEEARGRLGGAVYEHVWFFQEVDPNELSPGGYELMIGRKLTFDQYASSVFETIVERRQRSGAKLAHLAAYHQEISKKFPVYQGQMERERQVDPAPELRSIELVELQERLEGMQEESTLFERVAPPSARVKIDVQEEFAVIDHEALEQFEQSASRHVTVSASSRDEMEAKQFAANDYLFGAHSGRGPGGSDANDPSHFARNEKRRMPKAEEWQTHLLETCAVKQSWAEWFCGSYHMNLAKIVHANTVPIRDDRPIFMIPPTDYNVGFLLANTCAVVPRNKALMFIQAYSEAFYAYALHQRLVDTGSTSEEFSSFRVPCAITPYDTFSAVFYTLFGDHRCLSGCSVHGDQLTKSEIYDVLDRSERSILDVIDFSKWIAKTIASEIMFSVVRTSVLVLIFLGVPLIFAWLTRKRKATKMEKKQAQVDEVETESAQDRTAGAKVVSVESQETRTAAARTIKVEATPPAGGAAENDDTIETSTAPTGVRTLAAQGAYDQNAKELEIKVAKNIYAITCVRGDGFTRVGSLFFIGGRLALTNRHIAEYFQPDDQIMITNYDFKRNVTYSWRSIRVYKTSEGDEVHGYRDVALLRFPRDALVHPRLLKHFMTRADFCQHRELRCVSLASMSTIGHLQFRYSNDCVAVDRVQGFNLDCKEQGFHHVREWYAYTVQTQKGDCGGLLMSYDRAIERKFIGIHMAGGSDHYSAVAAAVNKEFIELLLEKFRADDPYPDDFLDNTVTNDAQLNDVQEERPFEGEYMYLGRVPPVYADSRTRIVPSPVAHILEETIGPAITEPAWLRTRNGIDPLALARRKAFAPSVFVDDSLLLDCSAHYMRVVCDDHPVEERDLRVLTYEEAIHGIPGDEFYKGIKRNTSPGYGWPKTGKGKTAYLGVDDWNCYHPLVIEKYNTMLDAVCRGERSGTVWTDTLKDERRPIEKVRQGKTRLFAAGELAYLILFRQFFMGFAAHMMRNRVGVESCVGINPYSRDWDRLASGLRSQGEHVVAGDFTNYDGTLSSHVLWECLDFINAFYSEGCEHRRSDDAIRRLLWLDIVHSVHVSDGTLYMWSHSQPSGCPITAVLNSLYHSIAARYVFMKLARRQREGHSLLDFSRYVAHFNFGDDDVYNIHPLIIEWYNQETMTEGFRELGMCYTDELKTGAIVKSRTLDDVQFLKRKFRFDRGQMRFRAPLALDTILEMARWVKGSRNHWHLTAETLQEAMMEAAEHDRDVYLGVEKQLRRAIRETSRHVSCPVNSYSGYQEAQYFKYCV